MKKILSIRNLLCAYLALLVMSFLFFPSAILFCLPVAFLIHLRMRWIKRKASNGKDFDNSKNKKGKGHYSSWRQMMSDNSNISVH